MTPNDVKIVADNIGDFIEVPSGINRLRTAIFALAISGKFAPAGTSSWKSSTLGEVCSVKKGRKPELYEIEGDKMLPYLEAKFIRGTKPAKFTKISDKNSVVVTEDDIIIICDGSNSGEFFTGVNGVLASTMGVLNYDKKIVSKKYLEVFLESNFELFNKARKGAAIPHLDFNLFNSLVFPLPSIEEQKRIVKKVEEAMKQLGELETKKRERDEVRTRLARSAMQALSKGESKIAFEQLTELIKTPADIKELEGTLLTLAVSGRLVPQDKKEGTAEELYSKIQTERAKKTESSSKKKVRGFAPITQEEIPSDIPKSWKWVRLGDIIVTLSGGGTPSKQNPSFWDGSIPWASVKDMTGKKYIDDTQDHITEAGLLSKPGLLKKSGSVVVCTRMGLGKIGILTRDMAINQDLKALILSEHVYVEYFYLQYKTFNIKGTGVTVDGITQDQLRSFPFSMPPFAEQKRIVKKVEEVMGSIEQLREAFGESKVQGRGRPKK